MSVTTWILIGAGFLLGAVVGFFVTRKRKIVEGDERRSFIRLLMDATSQESSKRFVVVMLSLFWLGINIVCVILLWVIMFKLFPVPPATVTLFFAFFNNIIDYDAFLISFGIGATTVSNSVSFLSAVLSKKADAAMEAAKNKVAENVTVNKVVKEQNIAGDAVTQQPQQEEKDEPPKELSKEEQEKENKAGAGADLPPQTGKGTVNIEEK